MKIISLTELMKYVKCETNKEILENIYGDIPKVKPLGKRNPIPMQMMIQNSNFRVIPKK